MKFRNRLRSSGSSILLSRVFRHSRSLGKGCRMGKVKKEIIESMYDLKKVLSKISDGDLKTLAFGFDGESDGSPALLAFIDDESAAMKIFNKKDVHLLSGYFEKIIEAVGLFKDDCAVDYYIDEPVSSETKFDSNKK
jgi:hypothetical protein